jgi:starch-binding outer membrane protein, SusD/RagB family
MRRTFASLVTGAAAVTLAGCNLDLTNPNNPTLGGALTNPRAATSRMITGVLATYRDNKAVQIRALGSFGRESYFMFTTDGRFITGPYRDWKLNNSFEAGTQWGGRYGNYRNAYAAMQIINSTTALTDEEKAGALGVLKTFIALDILAAIEARGAIGAAVDMTDDVNAVHPIVSEDSTYGWISAKLDEANAHLAAAVAGDTIPTFYFPMHSGFSGFGVPANTEAGFIQFNRAIKARVEVKRGSLGCGVTCYNAALTALGGTWIADLTVANRDNGVYLVYSTAAGSTPNTVSFTGTTDLYVHPLIDSIPGVAADDRYVRKTTAAASRTLVGVGSSRRPNVYATNTSPIPIIRNEELVLLRAEARWFTGATATAITDLVAVRTNSGASNGGTSAVAFAAPANDADFTTELLLQRTLSLFEEAHRWVDYRRFDRLAALGTLPQDVAAGFTVATASVLPNQECDARSRVGAPAPMSCPGGPAVP